MILLQELLSVNASNLPPGKVLNLLVRDEVLIFQIAVKNSVPDKTILIDFFGTIFILLTLFSRLVVIFKALQLRHEIIYCISTVRLSDGGG